MRIDPRSPRVTAVLGTLALLLLATAGWLLLLGPTASDVSEKRQAASSAAERNGLLASQLAQLEAKAEDLTATGRAARRLGMLFPPTAEQPRFFALLDEAVRRAGYRPSDVTTLSPTPPAAREGAAGEDLALQAVTLTVTGTAESARALLGELESLERAFLVRSVALTQADDSGAMDLTVVGTTFVAPPVLTPRQIRTAEAASGPAASAAQR